MAISSSPTLPVESRKPNQNTVFIVKLKRELKDSRRMPRKLWITSVSISPTMSCVIVECGTKRRFRMFLEYGKFTFFLSQIKQGTQFEMDPDTFARIMVNPFIHIPIEVFSTLRCYSCSGFRHSIKECTSSLICGKCSGSHKAVYVYSRPL